VTNPAAHAAASASPRGGAAEAESPTGAPRGGHAARPEDRIADALRAALVRVFRAVTAFVPTKRLALLIALLSPVWLLTGTTHGAGLVAIMLILVVIVVAIDALSTPARWQLVLLRELPAQIGLGDTIEGAYRVTSRAGRALRVRIFDRVPRTVTVRRARRGEEERIPPGGTIVIPFDVRGAERGEWRLGPVVLRVEGRLGLLRRSIRYEPDDSVLVVPSMAGLRRLRLLTLQHRLRDAGLRNIRRRGEGTTFANLREYVTGDDPRHVDWKATARRRRLITREYTVEQGQTVLIAIDSGRMMTQLSEGIPRFEHALSSAMLLASIATRSHDNVGLMIFDDEVRAFVPASRGNQALERIRLASISATASMAEPDYATAFRLLSERHRKRSLVVLFTDVVDPRASRALIAHTARSAARHILVVVALRNDHLVDAAIPRGHESAARLFESAAAEELVAAREEALQRMRAAGVQVVDVSPAAMTPAVINRYLEIKARGSL
jgi:uncharacterized protein (DUF58 family)